MRDGSRDARAKFDELLGAPGGRCAFAHLRERPDSFAGWAARNDRFLIFAYVLPVLRRRGLGSLLANELGFSIEAPIPLHVWTPSAQSIAASGAIPVYHAVFNMED